MDLCEYQKATRRTAIYLRREHGRMLCPALGLIGECGEVAEKAKKLIRDDDWDMTPDRIAAIKKELGDCMWYCANICSDTGNDLSVIYGMRGHIITQQIKALTFLRLVFHMNKHASIVAEALNRWYHDDNSDLNLSGRYLEIPHNLSHVVVCIQEIARHFNSTLEDICIANLKNLAGRQERGTVHGNGNNR